MLAVPSFRWWHHRSSPQVFRFKPNITKLLVIIHLLGKPIIKCPVFCGLRCLIDSPDNMLSALSQSARSYIRLCVRLIPNNRVKDTAPQDRLQNKPELIYVMKCPKDED